MPATLTPRQMLKEHLADIMTPEGIACVSRALCGYEAENPDFEDAGDLKIARAFQAVGKAIESRIKDERYKRHAGVIGETKHLSHGVLYEVVYPTEYWSVDAAAVKKQYPRAFPDGEPTPHAGLYRRQSREGYVKITLV